MWDPQEELVPIVSLADFGEVPATKITIKSDTGIPVFLKLLCNSLRVHSPKIQAMRVS